jgi:Fe2+ transport system protein FeoA
VSLARVLSDVAPGTRVRVVGLDAGPIATRRLAELGLVPGRAVTVVHVTTAGVVVAAGDSRLALGRALAATVAVDAEDPS